MTQRRLLVAIGLAASAAAVVTGLFVLARGDPPDSRFVALDGISPADVEEMRLVQPSVSDRPAFSEEQATSVALALTPGAEARETALARRFQTLVWVVNLDPDTVPPALHSDRTIYSLQFVDAMTGEALARNDSGHAADYGGSY
jgi:hypothetical protein